MNRARGFRRMPARAPTRLTGPAGAPEVADSGTAPAPGRPPVDPDDVGPAAVHARVPPLADEDWIDERSTERGRILPHAVPAAVPAPAPDPGFGWIEARAEPTVPVAVPTSVASSLAPVAAPPPRAPTAPSAPARDPASTAQLAVTSTSMLPAKQPTTSAPATSTSDDLIPPPGPARRTVRQDRTRRRWFATGLGLGAVLLVGLMVLVARGGSGSDAVADDGSRSSARAAASRARARSSSTTLPRSTSTSTTTTIPAAAVAPPAPNAADGGADDPSLDSPEDSSDPLAAVSVTEHPGACRWDGGTAELLDSGTLRNNGTQDADVEIEVTWIDATGELDSWSDFAALDPGETYDWDVYAEWSDPPQGLRCVIALF